MKLGSLCSGAGGLDMAVESVFGAETVWHCELDPAASKVLAHRWPGVPNHGDLINTDWSAVEPVDIMCAGWPCQPWSLAGKRKGAEDDRAIWPHIADAVRVLRPRYVCLENVSAVVGIGELWRVANDLAALGYLGSWTCLRASDVGAPHRRERLFVVATVTSGDGLVRSAQLDVWAQQSELSASQRRHADRRDVEDVAGSSGDGWHEGRPESAGFVGGSDAALSGDGPVNLLPTPVAHDGKGTGPSGYNRRTPDLQCIDHYLPTPMARDWKNGQSNQPDLSDAVRTLLPTPRTSDTNGAGQHGDGGMDLRTTVTLLQTPSTADGGGGHLNRSGARKDELLLAGQAREMASTWGKYAPAIKRWEQVLGRPAPSPTEPNRNGNPRLNPEFSSWMMGWPAGWVTDVPGISRNDALRIIGNGVVPQQCAAALRWLLSLKAVA